MKIIDICVLAYKSPLVGAYLTQMYAAGFMPRMIIDLRFYPEGRLHRYMEKFLGTKLSAEILHHTKHKNILGIINKKLTQDFMKSLSIGVGWQDVDYKKYSPSIKKMYISSINDDELVDVLKYQSCKTFLFTGGGILRECMLGIPGAKFIHIHPGIVPDIKGADGLLWSVLLRGRPGMSCFYMENGIDAGDIICTKEYELEKYNIAYKDYSYNNLYLLLLNCYDPLLRAQTLVHVLKEAGDIPLNELRSIPQDKKMGRMYHFMHENIRNCVIKKMFAMNGETS